jgi:hypothetical protein
MVWATMNGMTEVGAIPAEVSDRVRATVTAGLAKLVEEMKWVPVMYAPTANGAARRGRFGPRQG